MISLKREILLVDDEACSPTGNTLLKEIFKNPFPLDFLKSPADPNEHTYLQTRWLFMLQ